MSLSWKELPYSHNYNDLHSKAYPERYDEECLRATKIIHYHDAMWPWFWDTYIQCLQNTHPEVAGWLVSLGPLKNEAPLQWRITGKILKKVRALKQSKYIESCRIV